MAATTIFFNGRLISVPGSYTEVDASGLETVGLTASGIVACLGTAVGGKPWTEVGDSDVRTNLQVASSPAQPPRFFREGDLKEAAPLLFGPSDDEDIPAGAQEVVFVKTNPAAPSVASFSNSGGTALETESRDYGYFTTQINQQIGNGTNKGKLLTVIFEDVEEVFDDVGGDEMFKITFAATTPADGYSTLTATVTASELYSSFTVARAGLDSDISNQVTPGAKFELVSSDADDDQTVTVYGLSATNAAQSEDVVVDGTSVVQSTKTWNKVHGAKIGSAPDGTITIRNLSGGSTITTLTSVALTKGLRVLSDVAVAKVVLSAVRSASGTESLLVIGKNNGGAAQMEKVTLTGTTPVSTTGTWSALDYLAMGEVAAAGTVTVSAKSVSAPFAGLPTLQKLADRFNGTPGYTLTLVTGRTTFLGSDLDYAAATNVLDPAEATFYANLALIVEKLNNESALISAARATGGSGAPDNTTGPVYLAGGHEGDDTPGQEGVPTTTFADWQGALDLLKKVRVNTIVAITADPAVHAAVKEHCKYMGGVGRSERDMVVGVLNTGMTSLATKAEIKAQIVDLNTRHARVWAQQVERYNTVGEKELFDPPFGACIIAGMQAGSPVGTSLTWKYMNTLSLKQHSSWNPNDDAEEMIQAGLCFGETVDGVGRRVVRNVTTHLSSSNIAYTEASVNEAVNYAVYNFRGQMETMVGKSGFAGSVTAAYGLGVNILGQLVGVALVAYRSLQISLILDVLEVAVEMAPVLPINFVKSTVHLVAVPQSAATA
ncbi:MAG: hypothetical protein MUC88_00010 [Planctomycetes bacterium]|jgi:hypothetical protein|nr:hypothetical protein [Planctomycetota bacterium]